MQPDGMQPDGMQPDGMQPVEADYSQYHDPGTGAWEMGTPEECKFDPSMVRGSQNLAVFRYGKLCHIQGGNTRIQNYSATKTLGGVLAGRAAYLVKDVERTGPGTGPILHEDKVTDWISTSGYQINREALLSHVMSMTAYNSNLAHGSKNSPMTPWALARSAPLWMCRWLRSSSWIPSQPKSVRSCGRRSSNGWA
ncbi:MAG: hypothetical protein OXR73_29880, partial [Myxococcales bacterium]|nr:hypothetical protein [Myxococcales bacterium]